jgi:hypothetical protein
MNRHIYPCPRRSSDVGGRLDTSKVLTTQITGSVLAGRGQTSGFGGGGRERLERTGAATGESFGSSSRPRTDLVRARDACLGRSPQKERNQPSIKTFTSHPTETFEYQRVTTTRITPIWNATRHPSPPPGSGAPVSRVGEGPRCHQNLCPSRRVCPKCLGRCPMCPTLSVAMSNMSV